MVRREGAASTRSISHHVKVRMTPLDFRYSATQSVCITPYLSTLSAADAMSTDIRPPRERFFTGL